MKHSIVLSIALFATVLGGCSSSPPPQAHSGGETAANCTKPDTAKAKTHLADHVKYPATRAEILAACADTPEFTGAEKEWISNNLPEGDYKTADEAVRAMRL